MGTYPRLIYTVFLSIMLHDCYAKVGKASNHVTPIYINTADSTVKASVTDLPEKKPAIGRMYYWYAANQVCFTNGAYSGKLLHGQYSSYYPNHFLLAQGQFVRGLKDGRWMRWLPNGTLHEVIHYKNGLLHGSYETYSPSGQILQRIYYRNGAKTGKTKIFSRDGKDSVITRKKTTVDRRETGVKKTESEKSDVRDSAEKKTGDKKRGTEVNKKKSDSLPKKTVDTIKKSDTTKHKFRLRPFRPKKDSSLRVSSTDSHLKSQVSRLR